jgi:methylenetetrahydrofolate dehydrogenase (NADP+) / methenyltetrahydrofolate cyclohydrolase
MTATLINGRDIADEILSGIAVQVAALDVPLHLAAVCVGDDVGLKTFMRIKQKAAQSVGIQFSSYFFDADDEAGAHETLAFLAADESVQGIFIELPVPSAWDAAAFVALIPKSKDVDVLTRAATSDYYENRDGAIIPPAVLALRYVVDALAIPVAGVHAAVIGAGALVGKPVAHWLGQQKATVTVVDIDTPAPSVVAREADIVVAATGTPGLVSGEWIREGALVVDFGFGKKGDDYVGDVDAESAQKKAGFLTPVPGGMGPLVVAAVLENLLTLATR